YGTPPKPVTQMTLNELHHWGRTVLGPNFARATGRKPSSASGAFQIVGTTMMDAARALGLDPATTKFTPEIQRRMASWIARRQGLGAWEGFKRHPQHRAAAAAALAAGRDRDSQYGEPPPGGTAGGPGATGGGGTAGSGGNTPTSD